MIIYRAINPPQAITFDLDDTLYDNHPTIIQASAKLKAKMAEHYPKAAALSQSQLSAIKRELINNDPRLAWDVGLLRLYTLKRILTLDKVKHIDAVAQQLFDYFYYERSKVPIHKEVHDFLKRLSEKVPLVAITNGNLDAEQAGIKPYFNGIIHASITRPAKPHKHMFNEAAESLRLPPSAILHVGDSLINDVYGAYLAGFNTAWYAINRSMLLNQEKARVLPNIQLHTLSELISLV